METSTGSDNELRSVNYNDRSGLLGNNKPRKYPQVWMYQLVLLQINRSYYSHWAHLCWCTVGSYESLSVCPSVCLWLDQNYWTIIHISGTVWVRVTKFGMAISYILHILFGRQGQRSHWLGSNKGPKERQVGSHQHQVASFYHNRIPYLKVDNSRIEPPVWTDARMQSQIDTAHGSEARELGWLFVAFPKCSSRHVSGASHYA